MDHLIFRVSTGIIRDNTLSDKWIGRQEPFELTNPLPDLSLLGLLRLSIPKPVKILVWCINFQNAAKP